MWMQQQLEGRFAMKTKVIGLGEEVFEERILSYELDLGEEELRMKDAKRRRIIGILAST